MPDPATILLVDDEDAVQKLLTYPLERDGFRVVAARDGEEALERFAEATFDLVVLDLMLPKLDGLEVCKRLRAGSSVPIIMLTARDDELDKVLGLELGADDYITKPFSIREFRSRVRALLRRAATPRTADPDAGDELIAEADVRIDIARRTVAVRGEEVQLTFVEFELLRVLASSPGRVFSRRQLLERLRGGADYREPRTIDVHVRHLREKIESDPRDPALILTVRGVGYRFPGPMIRGIRLRLALALLVVVTGALVVAYLIVVPTLEARLVDAKLDQLDRDAATVGACIEGLEFPWQECSDSGAEVLNVRVVIYDVLVADPPALSVVADSRLTRSVDVERDVLAERATASSRVQRGVVTRAGTRFAEVAVPLRRDGRPLVFLLVSPLSEQLASVDFIERRLLVGGLIALVLAVLLGYLGATVHARRIRRLERAAERIASGRFDEPVVDDGNDELGELAAAFERMRLRLENLDRARREFIANASHELRTPLFSLGGFLELMTDEELDDDTRREFLVTMREQVDRLAKLATDLLDLSRLDAGRMHVSWEPVDLGIVAQTLAAEFGVLAERRGDGLAVEVEGEPVAQADELRVLQAGRALVDNALVHTPPGTHVVVRAWSESGRALLSVGDDGPGISPESAPHVFDRFYRVEGDVASGSGLGLAIARELATLMGGDVSIDSQPGRTVVTVALAAAVREHAEEPTSVFT